MVHQTDSVRNWKKKFSRCSPCAVFWLFVQSELSGLSEQRTSRVRSSVDPALDNFCANDGINRYISSDFFKLWGADCDDESPLTSSILMQQAGALINLSFLPNFGLNYRFSQTKYDQKHKSSLTRCRMIEREMIFNRNSSFKIFWIIYSLNKYFV